MLGGHDDPGSWGTYSGSANVLPRLTQGGGLMARAMRASREGSHLVISNTPREPNQHCS